VPRFILATLVIASLFSGPAEAQGGGTGPIVLDDIERIAFDRPEAWTLKYFTSVSILSGLGTPVATTPGTLDVSLEGGYVPSLDEEQRRVGFIGSKVEDLNRTSLFGRVRITLGLPGNFSLTVGVVPPIELDGVTPRLLGVAVGRPIFDSSSWRLGIRLHGQMGAIEGDLTCPRSIAGLSDSQLNPDDCLEPSSDEAQQNYIGLEVSATPKIWGGRWQPHVALSANYLDLEFQVGARYSAFLDETLLLTDGYTYSIAAGVGYAASKRLEISGEFFYSPLDVVRSPSLGAETDGLFNARLLLRHRLR
jgi:hypothetical protein